MANYYYYVHHHRHLNIFSSNAVIAAYAQSGRFREAVHLFQQMPGMGIPPDKFTLLPLLSACPSFPVGGLEFGKVAHALILASGLRSDTMLSNSLIAMYGKCGLPSVAKSVFFQHARSSQNVVAWTTLVSALARNGLRREALELFYQMKSDGVKPNRLAILSALHACSSVDDVGAIWEYIASKEIAMDVALSTAILTRYGKFGCLKNARVIFDQISQPSTVIPWNAMMSAYAHNGQYELAFELYMQMEQKHVKPDRITFLVVLSLCSKMELLSTGREIHKCIINKNEFVTDMALNNSLIDMYGKCGSIRDAQIVFQSMLKKDVITWNSMIGTYALNGHMIDAIKLLKGMELGGVKPDKITFLNILSGSSTSLVSLDIVLAIHDRATKCGLDSDEAVKSALVSAYGKCGSLGNALRIFNSSGKHDIISCTAMIAVFIENGCAEEALELFQGMDLQPNRVTFLAALDACISLQSLENGRMIHRQIVASSSFESDISLMNALINMYGKCGSLSDAQRIFNEMSPRNVASWTAIITAHALIGNAKQALDLFSQMELEGVKPDRMTILAILEVCASLSSLGIGRAMHTYVATYGFDSDIAIQTALVNMYGKCGSLRDAQIVFDRIDRRDVVSWTAMINACARNGHGTEAIYMFWQMGMDGVKPNKITYLSVLDACANVASLWNGAAICGHIVANGFDTDIAVKTALLDTYRKCGSLKGVHEIFNDIHQRDTISWNAMIAAHATNGCSKKAFSLFRQMDVEAIVPDCATFLSLITASNYVGLLGEGWQYFASMNGDFGLTPSLEHYMCIIDLVSRAGCLNEAEDCMQNMPIQFDTSSWNTLLGAFRVRAKI